MRLRNASCASLSLFVAMAVLIPATNVAGDELPWERWETRLDDPSASYRAQAADELAKLGSDAAPAVETLLEHLDDTNKTVRQRVAQALGYILARPDESIRALLPLLADDDEHVRYASEWAIARYALIPVTWEDAEKRLGLFRLAEQSMLTQDYHRRHLYVIREAIVELEKLVSSRPKIAVEPTPEPAPIQLADPRIEELRDLVSEFELSGLVAQLRIIDYLTTITDPVLVAVAQEVRKDILKQCMVRSQAKCIHFALHRWKTDGEACVMSLFDDLPSGVRIPDWTSRILLEASLRNHNDLEKLIGYATSKTNSARIRTAAITTLGRSADQFAYAPLSSIAASNQENNFLRCEAIRSLGVLAAGTHVTSEAELQLIQTLRNTVEPWDVRISAANTLGLISPLSGEAASALVEAATARDLADYELATVVEVLSRFGSLGLSGKDLIVRALAANESMAREAGISAIEKLGPQASDLTSFIIQRFYDPSESDEVRARAVFALDAIGPSAVALLGKELCGADEYCRLNGLNALARLDSRGEPALDSCLSILNDPKATLSSRSASAYATGRMGRVAQRAAPALRDFIVQAKHPSAQAMGIIALAQLGDLRSSDIELVDNGANNFAPRVGVAYAQYLTGEEGATDTLVRLLRDDDREYARSAILDIGAPSTKPLETLVGNELASTSERAKAAQVLSEIPRASYSRLLEILSDERIGDVCESCLKNAAPSDGGTVLLDELVAQLKATPDPTAQYRLEQVTEGFALNAALDQSVKRDRLAMLLQKDFEWEVYLQPLESEMLEQDPISLESSFQTLSLDESPVTETLVASEPALPPLPEEAEMMEPAPATTSLVPTQALLPSYEPKPDSPYKSEVTVFYGTNRRPTIDMYPSTRFGMQAEVLQKLLAVCAAMVIIAIWVVGYIRRQVLLYSVLAITGAVLVASLFGVRYLRITVPGDRADLAYSSEVDNDLTLGSCEVSIPVSHKKGELESASIVRFEFAENDKKHIALQGTRQLDDQEFFAAMDSEMTARGESLLVFVHGYNVSFEDAARRTAQLSYDLKFPGAPVFFSWPSQDNWYKYQQDRKNIELSVGHIKRFLLRLAEDSGAKSIHVVAHSMGSLGLTEALAEMAPAKRPMFNQVVLAAPDIDADIFQNRIAPRILDKVQRCTVYTSKTDLALLASRYFNAGQRVGEASSDLSVDGIDVIDASGVDTSLLGHSYYGEQSIIGDLGELLRARPISDRTFVQVRGDQPQYRIANQDYMAGESTRVSPIIR